MIAEWHHGIFRTAPPKLHYTASPRTFLYGAQIIQYRSDVHRTGQRQIAYGSEVDLGPREDTLLTDY